MSNMRERIVKVIVEQIGVRDDEVKDEASFEGDLGTDSLDHVELIMAIEEEFEIEITDEQAESISTVGELIALVQKVAPAN